MEWRETNKNDLNALPNGTVIPVHMAARCAYHLPASDYLQDAQQEPYKKQKQKQKPVS